MCQRRKQQRHPLWLFYKACFLDLEIRESMILCTACRSCCSRFWSTNAKQCDNWWVVDIPLKKIRAGSLVWLICSLLLLPLSRLMHNESPDSRQYIEHKRKTVMIPLLCSIQQGDWIAWLAPFSSHQLLLFLPTHDIRALNINYLVHWQDSSTQPQADYRFNERIKQLSF